MRRRQSVLSVLGLIFGRAWTKTTFDRMRKTRRVIKCLHGLIWTETFRDGNLFSWIGNLFWPPQSVVDIPGMWHLLRFVGIIVLCKVMEAGFLLPYTILVFLGISVLELGPIRDRHRQTSDVHHHLKLMPPTCRYIHIVCLFVFFSFNVSVIMCCYI